MSKALEVARELVKQLEEEERKNRVQLSTLVPGDVFEIGENDFIVLERMGSKTKVISKNFMAENVVYDENSRDYNESNLKRVIEDELEEAIENSKKTVDELKAEVIETIAEIIKEALRREDK